MLRVFARPPEAGTPDHRRIPADAPALPDRFRGLPVLDPPSAPTAAAPAPTPVRPRRSAATTRTAPRPRPLPLLHRLRRRLSRRRDSVTPRTTAWHADARRPGRSQGETLQLAEALDEKMRRLFGRSLKLRQVSAGGCNGCEADVNVLEHGGLRPRPVRHSVRGLAAPRRRHSLITGPVTENMELALRKTYEAVPAPKIVIAVGACAISGGPSIDNPEVHNGCGSRRAGGPVHPRLPAASRDDPRRPACGCLVGLDSSQGAMARSFRCARTA